MDYLYIPQGSRSLKITQDRLIEKNAIEEAGGWVAPYQQVDTLEDF